MDGNRLLSNVSCKYGAPMGRRSITDNQSAKVRLFRIIPVDGDYDRGGAYWGFGPRVNPLFCAMGDGFEYYLRADNHAEAKAELLDAYPDLKFYR